MIVSGSNEAFKARQPISSTPSLGRVAPDYVTRAVGASKI
jgi:hypothetical protein